MSTPPRDRETTLPIRPREDLEPTRFPSQRLKETPEEFCESVAASLPPKLWEWLPSDAYEGVGHRPDDTYSSQRRDRVSTQGMELPSPEAGERSEVYVGRVLASLPSELRELLPPDDQDGPSQRPDEFSTPGTSTPGTSTPGTTTPGQSTPGSLTPRSSTPDPSTPGYTPGQLVLGPSTPDTSLVLCHNSLPAGDAEYEQYQIYRARLYNTLNSIIADQPGYCSRAYAMTQKYGPDCFSGRLPPQTEVEFRDREFDKYNEAALNWLRQEEVRELKKWEEERQQMFSRPKKEDNSEPLEDLRNLLKEAYQAEQVPGTTPTYLFEEFPSLDGNEDEGGSMIFPGTEEERWNFICQQPFENVKGSEGSKSDGDVSGLRRWRNPRDTKGQELDDIPFSDF